MYQTTILEFTQDVWPTSLLAYIWLANPIIWILVSLQQGALVGTFCSVVRWMPLTNGFLPKLKNGNWKLPAMLLIPLTWCLINNKLGNNQLSLSIPWCMLEYTQWEQKQFLQVANIIGGIGISALIVMANIALFYFIASLDVVKNRFKHDFCSFKSSAINLIMVISILSGCFIYGAHRIQSSKASVKNIPHEQVTVIQGNILFGSHGKNFKDLIKTYFSLAKAAPPSICIWPEWSIPATYRKYKKSFEILSQHAKQNKQSWIIGCLDDSPTGHSYNAICGIDSKGSIFEPIYHKRYLVPFAETTPTWVLNSPLGFLCGTLTPRRVGYTAGTDTVPFELHGKKISPLLCCELASPELTAQGVRNGGQLIVDCSNTSWFESKTIGKQCIAACVLRAIENHRCLAFATTLGPSVIVDANGYVLTQTPRNKACISSKSIPFYSDITIFNKWFR